MVGPRPTSADNGDSRQFLRATVVALGAGVTAFLLGLSFEGRLPDRVWSVVFWSYPYFYELSPSLDSGPRPLAAMLALAVDAALVATLVFVLTLIVGKVWRKGRQ